MKVADLFAALGLEVDKAAFAAADDAIARIAATTAVATANVEHFSGVVLATMRAARGPVDDAVVSWDNWNEKTKRTPITLRSVLLGVTALGFALNSLRGFFGGVVEEFDKLEETSQRTGVAVEDLQALGYAAQFSGIETESLAGSLGKLQKNADAAAKGGKDASAAFRAVGVDAKGLIAGTTTTEEALLSIAEKFAGMEDGAAKSALAQKLFGRSGAELIPFLNAGRDGIARLTAEARDLGIVLGKDDVKAFAEFDDEITRMKASWKALKVEVTRALLPAFRALIGLLKVLAKNFDVVVLAVYSLVAAFVILRGVSVAAAYAAAKAWLIANAPLILMALGIMALILLMEDLYRFFTGGDSVFGEFYEAAKKWILGGVLGVFQTTWNGIIMGFKAMGDALITAFVWLGDAFKLFFQDFVIDPIMWVVEKLQWIADKVASTLDLLPGSPVSAAVDKAKAHAEATGAIQPYLSTTPDGIAVAPRGGTTNTTLNASITVNAQTGASAMEIATTARQTMGEWWDEKTREVAAQVGRR